MPGRRPSAQGAEARGDGYVVGAMAVAFGLLFMDRGLIGVLNEPIRRELGFGDFQMGLLAGPAIGLLYTVLALPLARLAERSNRPLVMGVALVVWSLLTALNAFVGRMDPLVNFALFVVTLSPMALLFLRERMWTGFGLIIVATALGAALTAQMAAAGMVVFGLFFLCRIGAAIGEAGCYPTATSLIADYVPIRRRAGALAIFTAGGACGTVFAGIVGGWLNDVFDWRVALCVLGAPGALVGLAIYLTVREPRRDAPAVAPSRFTQVLGRLCRQQTFWHVAIAATIAALVASGVGQFLFAFFSRAYGLTPSRAALYIVFVGGGAGVAGNLLSGWLSDRLGRKVASASALIPGVGLIGAAGLFLIAFQSRTPLGLVLAFTPATLLLGTWGSLASLIMQRLVSPDMRATAVAVMAFVVATVGYTLGPPSVGLVSDWLAAHALGVGSAGEFLAACGGRAPEKLGCEAARLGGLRSALLIFVCGYAWAGAHFLLAARSLAREALE